MFLNKIYFEQEKIMAKKNQELESLETIEDLGKVKLDFDFTESEED